jgi:hypothetical protein
VTLWLPFLQAIFQSNRQCSTCCRVVGAPSSCRAPSADACSAPVTWPDIRLVFVVILIRMTVTPIPIRALVRALRRYCTTVRLPINVHVGLLDHVLLQPALHNYMSGVDKTSRFSRMKFPCMLGVFDRAEPDVMLAISHSSVLPSAHWNSVGTLISDLFHGSIPCLHVPLSTLHV